MLLLLLMASNRLPAHERLAGLTFARVWLTCRKNLCKILTHTPWGPGGRRLVWQKLERPSGVTCARNDRFEIARFGDLLPKNGAAGTLSVRC